MPQEQNLNMKFCPQMLVYGWPIDNAIETVIRSIHPVVEDIADRLPNELIIAYQRTTEKIHREDTEMGC
jgi:hypothetical protein